MSIEENPIKSEVIRLLLETEGRLMLCLDATLPGVEVPSRFKTDRSLMLILNKKMPHPIDIDADAVRSDLRFGGIPHFCIIPYEAIWSVFNPDTNHGAVWRESIPQDVIQQPGIFPMHELIPIPPQKLAESAEAASEGQENKSTPFQVIEGGAGPSKTNKKSGKKPKLTVVE